MLISIKIYKKSAFSSSNKPKMLFFLLINIGILTFMSRKKFRISLDEHKFLFITTGPVCNLVLNSQYDTAWNKFSLKIPNYFL